MPRKQRRKHKYKYLTVGLLLLLGASAAIAVTLLPGGRGLGYYGNLAFLPSDLLSVFKKPEAPTIRRPNQAPRTSAGYQPGDIPGLPELPNDLPVIELADTSDSSEDPGTSPPLGGTGNVPKGGGGTTQNTSGTPNPNTDDGGPSGGGSGGGGGGGGSGGGAPMSLASLSAPDCTVEKCDDQDNAGCTTEPCPPKTDPGCTTEPCPPTTDTGCTTEPCPPTTDPGCTTEPCPPTTDTGCTTEPCPPTTDTGCTTEPCPPTTNSDCIGTDCLAQGDNEPDCTDPDVFIVHVLRCTDDESTGTTTDEDGEKSIAVDEPGPLSLLLIGALGLALARRARRKGA